MKRKIEHIPNMTVIGNALTYITNRMANFNKQTQTFDHFQQRMVILTLYKTMQTKTLRGIRKKFMMVLLASSGMYWDLIFMIDGQNIPTHASKTQKPKS